MINFNDTIIRRLKSMYTSFCKFLMFTWSQINTITLQLPYQLSASSLCTHSLSHFHLSSPTAATHGFLYSSPDVPMRVRSQGPGPHTRTADLNNAPPPAPADYVIRSTAARDRMSRLARHVTLTRYWNALTPGPSWICSNTGLADKSPPQVNQYTCWAGSTPTLTTHAADRGH